MAGRVQNCGGGAWALHLILVALARVALGKAFEMP